MKDYNRNRRKVNISAEGYAFLRRLILLRQAALGRELSQAEILDPLIRRALELAEKRRGVV